MKDDNKLPSPREPRIPPLPTFDPNSDLPPDADIEDRFNDFWKKNGPTIFAAIAVFGLIIVGYQVYGFMQERKADRIAAEFNTLQDASAKLEFAERHGNTRLGGIAWLDLADDAFAAENFADAASRYETATRSLAGSPLSARARLGNAMSRLRLGEENAPMLLDQLARDPEVLVSIRAEAAYLLAVTHYSGENFRQARRALDLLATFEDAPMWQQRGLRLESRLPASEEADV